MIQLSSSISSLSFKTNIKPTEVVLLPDITSVIHPPPNTLIRMSSNDMNTEGIGFVSIYIFIKIRISILS